MKIDNKILVVDNGYLAFDSKDFYANLDTNNFLSQLKEKFNKISVLQFHKTIDVNENILNSKVICEILSVKFNDENIFKKIHSYLNLVFKFLSKIHKFDLIHIFFPGNINFIILMLAFLFRKKYSVYVRGEIDFNNIFNKILFKNSEFLIANNPLDKEKLSNYNLNSYRIMDYLDLGNKKPLISNIKHLNFKNKIPTFLFVGRVEKRKGIYELVEAFEILYNLNFKFKLYVLGGGADFDFLFKEIKKKKLDQNILLQGQISSREIINDFYKKSDIFILPSYTEGFPRVIYTAMEYGLPIITTMVGGIPSVMKDEYNCLNVRVGSSDDIKNTIVKLIKNDDLFKKLKINSQKTIRQIISNEEIKIHEDILINFLKTQ